MGLEPPTGQFALVVECTPWISPSLCGCYGRFNRFVLQSSQYPSPTLHEFRHGHHHHKSGRDGYHPRTKSRTDTFQWRSALCFCGIADYGNSKHIIYEADGKSKNGPRLPSNLKTLYIRSVSGFEKRDTNRQYTTEGQHFLYSIDGQNFYPFGDEYRMGTGNFRGDMVGICTYNNQNNRGYIDVDKFHYHIKNKPATRP